MMAYLGAAMCALAAILVLRAERSEFAAFVGMAAAVILMGAAVSDFLPAVKTLAEAASGTAFEGYFPTLLRALGITFAVELAAEVCRDAGEIALEC
ncbi:MAG: hypothetical protein E7632_05355, partial [Ruminococcaceae bacterium]|nr:hypothetical protein [Oscillospiraceae bacterium]